MTNRGDHREQPIASSLLFFVAIVIHRSIPCHISLYLSLSSLSLSVSIPLSLSNSRPEPISFTIRDRRGPVTDWSAWLASWYQPNPDPALATNCRNLSTRNTRWPINWNRPSTGEHEDRRSLPIIPILPLQLRAPCSYSYHVQSSLRKASYKRKRWLHDCIKRFFSQFSWKEDHYIYIEDHYYLSGQGRRRVMTERRHITVYNKSRIVLQLYNYKTILPVK